MTLWDVDETVDLDPVADTASHFRPSLVERAKKREVTADGDDSFIVAGSTSLGDSYPDYRVNFNGSTYSCECQSHGNGQYRRGKNCSHVVAVALHRAKQRRNQMAIARARGRLLNKRLVEASGQAAERDAEKDAALAEFAHESLGAELAKYLPPPPSPQSHLLGNPPLPDKFLSFRDTQWQAIQEVLAAYESGAKVVFCQAPPGTGKTLLAETVRRLGGWSAVYVCSTKALQQQFVSDFNYAALLQGRSNYPTMKRDVTVDLWGNETVAEGQEALTAADCTKGPQDSTCRFCDPINLCPYRLAKGEAERSRLAVLNTAYWLAAANHTNTFNDRDLVICDEADLLEGELMGLVEVRLTKGRVKRLGIDKMEKVTVPESWLEWIRDEVIPKVEARLRSLPSPDIPTTHPKEIREGKSLKELYTSLLELQRRIPEGEWVLTGDYNNGEYVFKPVRVDAWGTEKIWRHGERFLLMSATIISAQEMAESLGLSEDQYAVVDVPMTFPVENRVVHVGRIGPLTAKNKEKTWPEIADACRAIAEEHPEDRILIHTVSYALAQYVEKHLRGYGHARTVSYANTHDKALALERYLANPKGILIAPSMDRGVDLPGDACRVQIVAKVPYPYLGDKQVNARLHSKGGQLWYVVQAVRSLVQMTGRGVRSEDDWCTTYILDAAFKDKIFRQKRRLLPKWWVEGLDFEWGKRGAA